MNSSVDRETRAIREAATDWVVQLSSEGATGQERVEFAAWLRRSPAHVAEYLHAEAAWQAMEGAASEDRTSIPEVIGDPRSAIVDFPGAGAAVPAPRRGKRPAQWVAVAAALAMAAVFGPWIIERLGSDVYSTGIGESRRLVLADGSELELNTRTKVRLRMTATGREATVDGGEVFFKVAPDPARPFRVRSDAASVRVLGTEFNVYRQSAQTIVTVIEGRIAIDALPDALTAGHRVVVPADGAGLSLTTVDPRGAIAWRERRLVLENETLGAAVREFNRYNTRQLIIDSPALAGQRISGVFKVDRPDALVDFLTQTSGVRATDASRSRTLLRAGP